MKLKISYNTTDVQSGALIPVTNFVTIIPKDVTTVEGLKKHLEQLLAQRLGVQRALDPLLTTSDGFELTNSDNLSEILQSSIDTKGYEDHVVAYDMRALFRRERDRLDLDTPVHLLEKDDFVDSVKKSIKIGQHKHGKLYIQFIKGNLSPCLHLLSVEELKKIREDLKKGTIKEKILGKWSHLDDFLYVLDMTKSATKKLNPDLNWELETKLILTDSDKEGENRITVQNTIKVSSDVATPVSVQVPIEWEGVRVKKSEREVKQVTVTVVNTVEEQPLEYFKALIPAPIVVGDVINNPATPTLQKYQDSGDSDFHLLLPVEQQDQINTYVTCNQDTFARDGKFDNYFFIPGVTITLQRDSTSILSIVKLELEYQDHNNQWNAMHTVNFGYRYQQGWNWRYQWFDECNVNMKGGMSDTLAVRGAIQVTGKPGDDNETRSRAHASLPQPLKLRIRITDNEGKQRELIVEQANKPLNLPTLENRIESWDVQDKEFMKMVTCDDTDKLQRIFTAFYLSKKDKAIVLRYSYGTYFTFDSKVIKTLEFKAAKKEETELESHKRESSDGKWHTYARFDTKTGVLYAFRVTLETSTGKREEVVLVKDILDEVAKLQ
ncbi:hypothetical protein ABK040_003026 [Willaertia magna]